MELSIQIGRRVPAHRLTSRIPETRIDQAGTIRQGSLMSCTRPASSLLALRTSRAAPEGLRWYCAFRMAPVSTLGVPTDDCSLEPMAPSGDSQCYIKGASVGSGRTDDSILKPSIWPECSLRAVYPVTPCAARWFAVGCILGPPVRSGGQLTAASWDLPRGAGGSLAAAS
ncbi:hypothetical protein MTO96_013428 [Rhipicephalus appendiculatus]